MSGFDVSKWQGAMDWAKARAKADFAFIKCSEGLYVDQQFARNWAEAKRVGIKRGAYMFYRFSVDPGQQARTMVQALAGDYGELPLVIDLEDIYVVGLCSTAQIADLRWCLDVLERFSGKRPIIYTAAWWCDPALGNAPWLSSYDLWVANYVAVPTSTPILPMAWLYKGYKYWQWSNAGIGADYGAQSATIDLNIEAGAQPVYPVITFAAAKNSIVAGASTSLIWSVEGVEGVWLDGRGVAGVASTSISPATTSTYTLNVQFRVLTTTTRTVTVNVTQPQPVTSHYLGVNVIGQTQLAIELSATGCKAFVVVDNPGTCESIKLAHPDAVVVNRRWSNDPLNGQQQWDKFGASCNTGVINEIFNEADGSHSYGSVEQLRLRIDQEFQYADIARSKGALVALGCFSMGTPDFNNTAICEQMKRYAARYNSDPGIYFSLHNYSPTMAHIDDDSGLIWYETRFKFLFEKCGFNPALRKIIATETGVDEGGVGGFPAHHATSAQFTHWCERYQKIIANTQVIASMIFAFTAGRDAKWAGYDIAAWQGELAKAAGW